MKPIFFYDANVFIGVKHEDLEYLVTESINFISDDIVKELLEIKDRWGDNSNLNNNTSLFFNTTKGLNDNIYLSISQVPFGMGDTYENTRNVINLKSDALICSMYHQWLPCVLFPCLITDKNRHLNSELTWNLLNKSIDDNLLSQISNIKNKIKIAETKIYDSVSGSSEIEALKLFRTWSKRDKDIKNGKYNISDGKLILHAVCTAIKTQSHVNIITCDYDVIDMEYNFYASVIDGYVIWEVLKEKGNFCDATTLSIPKIEFYDCRAEVENRIKNSSSGITITVWLYKRDKYKMHPVSIFIPDWMLNYIVTYKANVDCYSLDSITEGKNLIHYRWYSDSAESESIKVDIFRKETFSCLTELGWSKCKMFCRYEFEELNSPQKLCRFVDGDS